MSKLPNEDIDSYVIKLKALRGTEFEDEVGSLFSTNYPDFQPVVTLPRGDGGTDGLYEKRTFCLCCYGLNDVEIHYTPANKKKAIVKKYTNDFMRLLELTSSGRGKAKTFSHKKNDALGGILSDGVKITHIKLICNWNEDNGLIGVLNTILKDLIARSQCNFLDKNCDCTLLGPKEVVSLCAPTLEHYARLRYPDVFKIINSLDDYSIEGSDPDQSEMDFKFDDLNCRFAKGDAVKEGVLLNLKSKTENKWIEDIVFKQELGKNSPNVLLALNEIRDTVVKELELSFLGNPNPPLLKIEACKESFRDKVIESFHLWDKGTVERVVDMMVASLIGECPLDWRESV